MSQKSRKSRSHVSESTMTPVLEQLESRLLLSADLGGAALADAADPLRETAAIHVNQQIADSEALDIGLVNSLVREMNEALVPDVELFSASSVAAPAIAENVLSSSVESASALSVTINSSDAGQVVGGKQVIDVRATITGGDPKITWSVRYIWPDRSSRVMSKGTGPLDNALVLSRTMPESGIHTIEITVTDSKGNTAVARQEVKVDSKAAWVNNIAIATDYPLGAYHNRPFKVVGDLKDADTPLDQVSWKVTMTNTKTGAVQVVATGMGNPQNRVFATINPADYPSGLYSFAIETEDIAGNKGRTQGHTERMDGHPPVVTRVENASLIKSARGYILKVFVEGMDDTGLSLVGVEYFASRDGSGKGEGARSYDWPEKSGSSWLGMEFRPAQTVTIRPYVVDKAGNKTYGDAFTVIIPD